MSTYSEKVRRLIAAPPNLGPLETSTHYGEADNPVCGDRAAFWILVARKRIERIAFRAEGCPAALAAAAGLTELAKGMDLNQALNLEPERLIAYLDGLPPHKRHGAELAVAALRNALEPR